MKYDEFYVESIRNPKGFWKRQAQNLIWDDFPTAILREAPHGGSHWFADGRLNMSYLCIDRHLEAGHGDQVAIYYDS
ncbi:MAG: acetyl-coenzyme A synthetase N-terminal domain-containing protein, partial [Bacteroidota bacterium]